MADRIYVSDTDEMIREIARAVALGQRERADYALDRLASEGLASRHAIELGRIDAAAVLRRQAPSELCKAA